MFLLQLLGQCVVSSSIVGAVRCFFFYCWGSALFLLQLLGQCVVSFSIVGALFHLTLTSCVFSSNIVRVDIFHQLYFFSFLCFSPKNFIQLLLRILNFGEASQKKQNFNTFKGELSCRSDVAFRVPCTNEGFNPLRVGDGLGDGGWVGSGWRGLFLHVCNVK